MFQPETTKVGLRQGLGDRLFANYYKMTDRHFERMHAVWVVRNLPQDSSIYSEEAVLASLKFQKLLATLESSQRAALQEKDDLEGGQKFPANCTVLHFIDFAAMALDHHRWKA